MKLRGRFTCHCRRKRGEVRRTSWRSKFGNEEKGRYLGLFLGHEVMDARCQGMRLLFLESLGAGESFEWYIRRCTLHMNDREGNEQWMLYGADLPAYIARCSHICKSADLRAWRLAVGKN